MADVDDKRARSLLGRDSLKYSVVLKGKKIGKW